jgi:predicted short-subunit dehydrogenase-like oxidoreductase (DUF2520 family)
MSSIRVIGPGRAGWSFALALSSVGHIVDGPLGRHDDLSAGTSNVDLLILAVPDDELSELASSVERNDHCVVVHLSGSLGLGVLAPHLRRASLHPLAPLPTPEVGMERLLGGVTLAVAGDPAAAALGASMGATLVEVRDEDRAAYHAAACVASNHVVALLGQVERIAASIGLPVSAFLELTRAAVDDVAVFGPRAALTGPAARGDWDTIARHLDALDPSERAGYGAAVALALELAGGQPAADAAMGTAAPLASNRPE